MNGGHFIKGWAKAQQVVTLSCAEAELYAMLKAATEGIGMAALLAVTGIKRDFDILADSSTATSLSHHQRLGKLCPNPDGVVDQFC